MVATLLAPTALLTPDMDRLVRMLRRRSRTGCHYGRSMDMGYMRFCTEAHPPTGTRLIYTRDAGHHTSGWLKNPQYERCLHLSLSFWEYPGMQAPRPYDRNLAELWVRAFFGEHCRWLWEESPFSPIGKQAGVRHWRLFCDADWTPILPRGEVYSTALTEMGWKSWSELHPSDPLAQTTRAMQMAQ